MRFLQGDVGVANKQEITSIKFGMIFSMPILTIVTLREGPTALLARACRKSICLRREVVDVEDPIRT